MLKITERQLTWAFAATLLILAGNALVSYRDLAEQVRNTPLVVRSRQILAAAAGTRAAIFEAEMARRGLLIDANRADRAELDRAGREAAARADDLADLTRDRPDQHRRARDLARLGRDFAAELGRPTGPAGAPPGDPAAGLEPIRARLADLGRSIAAIEADEMSFLALRVRDRRAGISRSFVTFSVAMTLALIAMGTTYALVRRYLGDRRDTERSLQESEAKVRLLLDSVGEGIYGIDVHGRCTFCNPSALRLLGFASVEEVLGHDMHRLVHHSRPDGSPFPPHQCPIYQTFRSGIGILGVEDYFYRADGRPVPVEYRAHAIHHDGEILGAVVTFVDIAPKRHAEIEMRLRDRALRAIAQGVFIIDPTRDGQPIVYANAAFERLTGYGPLDRDDPSFDWLREDQPSPAAEAVRAAARDGRDVAVELLARRKDGSTFWQALTLAPIEDPDGRTNHLVGVITDVSERRAAEQKLRNSEGRLRSMFESVRDYAIYSIDRAGRVSGWNPGAERLFGYAEAEILGRPTDLLFLPEDRLAGLPTQELARAEATGRADDDRWYVRGDGTRFLASGLVTAVRDPAGTLLGYTKVARDITESKRAETELRAAKDAAESAIRAKSTFLANMGHELRTPLNAIIGYSEMLEDEATERGVKDFVPDLERIKGAGLVLLKLVNNVLDLSRIEAGGMDLADDPIDIGDLIRGVVRAVEHQAERRGNVVQVEYPNDLGTLNADSMRVSQGLGHLLSNAIKFTEAGTIIVRVTRQRDDAGREWVVFVVADDGIGMTRDELSRLFQPFVQADGSAARRFGGTGLGLTITHRFCRMMGGTIEVTSEPGQGSTFSMKLPAGGAESPGGTTGPVATGRPIAAIQP